MFQSQFELGDLPGFVVGQQPVVGVAAVVALAHDLGVLVDGTRVLHRFARAHKFWNAIRVETVELRDRRFRYRQPGGVHAEIVVTGDDAGIAIHQDAVALLWRQIENDVPARALVHAGPVVVRDYDLVVFGIAAGGHQRAAVSGRMNARRVRDLVFG